ncbi:MAG: putative lipopolysaccharide heptosyltransferase III [Candidatus Methylomirabilis sp.]
MTLGIERILVIKLKHIGDVLLATPAIHALRKAFPKSRICALVYAGTDDMLTGNPDLEEVLVFEKGTGVGRIRNGGRLVSQLRRIRPDLAVQMGNGDREAILGVLSGARIRVGYDPRGSGFLGRRLLLTHIVPQDWEKHVVESNLDLVRALGVEPDARDLRLFVDPQAEAAVNTLVREMGVEREDRVVTIHPTAKWMFKCWTDEGFAQVADYLSEEGMTVCMTSGSAEREVQKAQRIIGRARRPVIDLSGRLSLKQLTALVARSRLFVGVDSAPMHVAAAIKTPVVALFGPSREQNWRPWGDGHLVLKRDPFCSQLRRKRCEVTKRCECLETLRVEEVIAAVEEQLAKSRGHHNPGSGSMTADLSSRGPKS